MINENWAKWVYSSILNHFEESEYFIKWETYLEDPHTYDEQGITPMYIDGCSFDSKDVKDYIEIRIEGPDIVEVSNNYFKITLDLNILTSVTKDSNIWKTHELVGKVQKTFSTISVYRYGSGTEDNNSLVGCLNRQNKMETIPWGQPDPNIKQIQQTIESQYKMQIKGD